MSFRVEYQYDCWAGREGSEGSRWWITSEREFKSKGSRTRFINKMSQKYPSILFREKHGDTVDERDEDEQIVMTDKTVIVYTDGSAYHKDRLGGVGIYMKFGEIEKIHSQGYSNTTNNRMELRAVIEAMKMIVLKDYDVHIYSDSEYVVNTLTSWIFNWEKDNYVDRKNVDLLKEALKEYRKFKEGSITMHWCRGHNGVLGNEIADELAGEGRASGQYIECLKED